MFRIRMPLSFVIEHTTQSIFPLLHFLLIVKPVFLEHGDNIEGYNLTHPFLGTLCLSAEIAMADAETFAKGIVLLDCTIQNP